MTNEELLPMKHFANISAIPRATGNEAGVADYLESFAKAHSLYCYRDVHHNVLIKKAGSKGRESEPPVLLQGHTDMVCEQNEGTGHDFAKEGIELLQEGNILRADGTTLGADNGVGVALMLAVLEAATSHPPLECLFTSAEEVGLVGAGHFDYSHIKARRLVNLDSAEEHSIIVACCGGLRTELTLPQKWVKKSGRGLKLSLKGLCGGHSGEDIHRGRANAHVTMGKLLGNLAENSNFCLSTMRGGDKDNAIPRECTAVVLPDDYQKALMWAKGARACLSTLITAPEDAHACLEVEEVAVERVLDDKSAKALLEALRLPNGPLRYREDDKRAVDASRNLAKVEIKENSTVINFSSRAYRAARIEESKATLDAFAAENGGTARHFSPYPGWESPANSAVATAWREGYARACGKELVAMRIHAGLECGVISAALGGVEAISIGCNIYDLHTPAERMEIDSFSRIYSTLLAFLDIIK